MNARLNAAMLGIVAIVLVGLSGCAATTDTSGTSAGGTTNRTMADSTHAATPSSAMPDTSGKPH